jgi:hypothetical protein
VNRLNNMNHNFRNLYWIMATTISTGCYCNVAVAKILPAVNNQNTVKVTLYQNQPIIIPVQVVRDQLEAMNHEDFNAAINAIHPSSPGFEKTKDLTEELFKVYDLRYSLKEITLESENTDTAKVKFSQLTEKVSGQEFRNNLLTGVHILKKYNGEWKIYDTQIIKIEFLDKFVG